MTTDDFIQSAIDAGQRHGVDGLSTLQRAVFLVSELEALCDMEGIDAFLDRYQANDLRDAADLLSAAGVIDTATSLMEIANSLPNLQEAALSRANKLVTSRAGYDHDGLARAVAQRMAQP